MFFWRAESILSQKFSNFIQKPSEEKETVLVIISIINCLFCKDQFPTKHGENQKMSLRNISLIIYFKVT